MEPSLDIIIVNWNSGNLIYNCVKSIFASENINEFELQVIIIDNNSSDNSMGLIPNDSRIIIIKNNENKGFGFACNQGFKIAKNEFILLLNPDAIVKNNTLTKSLKFISKNDDISILGVKQVGKNNVINRGCSKLPTVFTAFNSFAGLTQISQKLFPAYKMVEWDHSYSRKVDHVTGSFMLFKRDLLKDIKGMDECFFMYYEDLDFSARVKKMGGKIYYWTKTEIYHEGGGVSKQIKSNRLYYSLLSRIRYMNKHLNKFGAIVIIITILFIEPFTRLSNAIIRFKFSTFKETIIAFNKLYHTLLFSK